MQLTTEHERIDLHHYLSAVKRHRKAAIFVFCCVFALTALYTFTRKPIYEGQGELQFQNPDNTTSAMKDADSRQRDLTPVGSDSDPVSTQVEVINSLPIAQETINTLNLNLTPKQLQQGLKISRVDKADILKISFKSRSPKEAAAVVNQVMNLYLQRNIFTNRANATADGQFILKELPRIQVSLLQAEIKLRKFRQENNIVDLDAEAKSAVGTIASLESQLGNARVQYADTSTQAEMLRNQLNMTSQSAVSASALSQSTGVQQALAQLHDVESKLAVARTTLTEEHPRVVNLKEQKASLEALLKGRVGQIVGQEQEPDRNLQFGDLKQQITKNLIQVEAQRSGFASQISTLSKLLANYEQRVNSLPKLQQQQTALQREVDAAKSTYETLLKRLEEIRVEQNRTVGNAHILEFSEIPKNPVSPKIALYLVLGGILGILFAVVAALVLDALDTSIKTVDEARKTFEYTLLGIIPSCGKSDRKLVVLDKPFSRVSEMYRILQANLGFLTSDRELKVVVVTSSVPKEGKSTIAANLAAAMAQSERKVLLIDADMRCPSQHHIWNLRNKAGLSNVLVGKAEPWTVIEKVMANLHILTAGVSPPNPMNLLNSKRMSSLVESFTDSYDFVIIDTPSLNVAADAAVLGKMSDGILFVVRPRVVDSASAASAQEFLEHSDQNVLGQVINDVTSFSAPYGSYYARKPYVQENDEEFTILPSSNLRSQAVRRKN